MQSCSNVQVSGNIQIQVAIAPGRGSIVVEKADSQVRTAIDIEPIRSELNTATNHQPELPLRAEEQRPARRGTGQLEKITRGRKIQLKADDIAQQQIARHIEVEDIKQLHAAPEEHDPISPGRGFIPHWITSYQGIESGIRNRSGYTETPSPVATIAPNWQASAHCPHAEQAAPSRVGTGTA